MKRNIIGLVLLLTAVPLTAQPQERILTLEECRQMALEQSRDLVQARTEAEMADYDRKIALANYFPKVSATGAYIYNTRDVALVSDEQSERIRNMGTNVDNQFWDALNKNASTIGQDILNEFRNSGRLPNIATPLNEIGAEIDASLHPDLHNIWLGAVTVEQPLFTGGKIIYSNQMARLAKELAASKYDLKEAEILTDVDQAYWQIVSIAAKKELAQSYSELLQHMQEDVEAAIAAGVSTSSDALQVKVKANEARMLLTKATNGLALAKMLLCHRIGLPMDTPVRLFHEGGESLQDPLKPAGKSMEDIYNDRPETRSLQLASQIFDKKAKVVRADMMPTVALLGAFTVTNPNMYNGLQNTWQGGNFSAGVLVRVPIFHAGEALFKYKKAQAEATLYSGRLQNAREMISLQVSRQRLLFDEAAQKVAMARSNLESAEENLRTATVGHEAGVIPTNTVLSAHTAWLSAHSEYIDAQIEWQMAAAALRTAEGE